ncbi:phosphatidylglycerophosphatase A family protein [Anaerorhabdus sp.]|jgi:phosphatidylglycerophosphatase A|uniref:phosphatidylglycerophosphatase A family protein n=1 Tax=Anaerorhabdus sp. TaxID=1872524 RepID=UPI002B1F4FB2|nr:phosphatidylglycerophosphatase A [Anaerorhabdus sp.]MEA4876169.1 phosphatidylglycerophosphatase A [Anaerorhabdus sp.]
MYDVCVRLLHQRGVELRDIAECSVMLQKQYFPDLLIDDVIEDVKQVLCKREVQHAVITGINLDIMADKGCLESKELEDILLKDYSLYGVDEVLAYGICNIYGSIALTNYGYIDRVKPGIIGLLNEHNGKQCNTFLDDIVGAIAASAASRIAHSKEKGDCCE